MLASYDLESDLNYHIKKSGHGICVEPESVEFLKEAILNEYFMRDTKKDINTRQYVFNNASKEICVQKYINVLNGVLN